MQGITGPPEFPRFLAFSLLLAATRQQTCDGLLIWRRGAHRRRHNKPACAVHNAVEQGRAFSSTFCSSAKELQFGSHTSVDDTCMRYPPSIGVRYGRPAKGQCLPRCTGDFTFTVCLLRRRSFLYRVALDHAERRLLAGHRALLLCRPVWVYLPSFRSSPCDSRGAIPRRSPGW